MRPAHKREKRYAEDAINGTKTAHELEEAPIIHTKKRERVGRT